MTGMIRIPTLLLLTLLAHTTQAALTVFITTKQPTCTHADGRLRANPSGGVGPYTYAWSTGETTQVIDDLLPGSYSVTVTDLNMDQASANTTLTAGDYGQVNGLTGDFFNYGEARCMNGTTVGFDTSLELVGPAPYFIGGVQLDTLWYEEYEGGPMWSVLARPLFNPMNGQMNTFTFADADGCPGTYLANVGWPVDWPTLSTLSIQGACDGTASGSITISSTGEGHEQFVQTLIEPFVSTYPGHQTGGAPSTFTITGLAAGSYTLTQFMSMLPILPSSGCEATFSFTIPSLGPDCGLVSGNAFVDDNQNCVRNGSEPYVPGTILEIQPGPFYLVTDQQGYYEQVLPLGDYTVEQQSAIFQEHCTGAPIPFTLEVGTSEVTRDLPDTSLVTMDAMVAMSSGFARPGFQFNYGVQIRNLTPTSTGAVTVTLNIDPTLIYLSATPPPNNVNGNTLTWNQAALGAWQERYISIYTQVPPDITLLGTLLSSTASLTTTGNDGDLSNNSATKLRTITGAYDPNDKLATTSSGSSSVWQLDEDEWIDYTIRFQNSGTDTAFTVIVTDTLPTTLDPGSIVWGAASHTNARALQGQGILTFNFPNILLPDSNVNEAASHGFVSFRIKPFLPILPGTVIENTANIFFDFNDPVITEPSVLVAEFSTGIPDAKASSTYVAYPVPAAGRIFLSNVTSGNSTNGWSILQVDGRVIRSSNSAFPSNGVDVSDLADGNYLLQVNSVPMPVTIRFAKSH